MPSNMQLLQLEPQGTLHLRKTSIWSSPLGKLKLSNLSSGNVAFKVKTTMPNDYLLRPASGMLRPNGSQEVQIILQPHSDITDRHRFLVQAVSVPNSQEVSREQWGRFPKETIQQQRLGVALKEQLAEMETITPSVEGTTAVDAAKIQISAVEQPSDLKVKYDETITQPGEGTAANNASKIEIPEVKQPSDPRVKYDEAISLPVESTTAVDAAKVEIPQSSSPVT